MTENLDRDPAELEQQAIVVAALASGLEPAVVAQVIDTAAPLIRRAHTLRLVEQTRKLYEQFPATRPPQEAVFEVLDGWLRSVDRQ